jgi:hypothetical protein
MLLWTNDNLISTTQQGIERSLELWLCQFRDLEFSELITNTCDLAFLNALMPTGGGLEIPIIARLVIPREPGSYGDLLALWHEQTQPYYPHLGITVEAGVIGGSGSLMPPVDPGQAVTRRYRLWGTDSLVDALDIHKGPYQAFLDDSAHLRRFGIYVDGSSAQLRSRELLRAEPWNHRAFTLQPA